MPSQSSFPNAPRELLRTQQVFLSYAARHVHKFDLTLPQFDVVITLGCLFRFDKRRHFYLTSNPQPFQGYVSD